MNSTIRLLQEAEEQIPFGQQDHINMMPYLWTFVIDIGIFFALYKYRKYSLFLHIAIGLFVALTTLITSLPILIAEGIPSTEDESYEQRHFIIGFVIIIFILIQVVIGLVSRILQFIPWSSSLLIYLLNMTHKYLGYGFLVIAKLQVFLILQLDTQNSGLFWGLIASEIFLIPLLLWRKLQFKSVQGIVIPNKLTIKQFKQLKSSDQVEQQGKPLAIFANYVFNLQPLLSFHPIGYQIIRAIKGRDLDRYLYGMYTAERIPFVPTNSHSFKSLELLGQPLGKLNIQPLYEGLQKDVNEITIESIQQISAKGSIYEIHLVSDASNVLYYKGYTSLLQIGRYYALNMNQSITRLYTSVGFLDNKNIQLIQRIYLNHNKIELNIDIKNTSYETQNQSSKSSRQQFAASKNYLPLLIKSYPNGALTSGIIKNHNRNRYTVSSSRGEGLKLNSITPGRIIIVAGGTGLFPFCDLIDLLFKAHLIRLNQSVKEDIVVQDSLLETDCFKGFSFELMLALNFVQDIHPLTLVQIKQLTKKSGMFKVILKIRDRSKIMDSINENLSFADSSFQKLLEKELDSGEQYSKIWVCGPPPMNKAMMNLFDCRKIDEDKYLFI